LEAVSQPVDLLELGAVLHLAGGRAGLGQRREQKAEQERDDGHHDQQFDQGEAPGAVLGGWILHG